MKIVLITDSLGCPRDELKVEKTWVYRFLEEYSKSNIIYTFIKHGLTTDMIDNDLIRRIHPDYVFVQVGIVDGSRRANSSSFLKFISYIPFLSKMWKQFSSTHHYQLTKLKEIHKVKPDKFEQNIKKLVNIKDTKTFFIRIADAGEVMTKKTYNVKSDIMKYNEIIKSVGNFIDPYYGYKTEEYILESDGHHLNEKGHLLVFETVKKIMVSLQV